MAPICNRRTIARGLRLLLAITIPLASGCGGENAKLRLPGQSNFESAPPSGNGRGGGFDGARANRVTLAVDDTSRITIDKLGLRR